MRPTRPTTNRARISCGVFATSGAIPTDARTLRIQAAAALRLRELERAEKYAVNPWAFMTERVNLLDPLSATNPVRPYPDLPYLRHLVAQWERYRKTITWKPRRTRVSWTALAYADAKCAHKKHQRGFIIAKKQGEDRTQGSRELLWRAGFIMQNLRGDDGKLADKAIGEMLISFPNGSTLAAVSSEPNALRQVSGTIVIGDEFAFYDYPELSLAAFLPTLEEHGQFLGISSSAAGYFERTVHDLEEGDDAAELDEFGVPVDAVDVTTFPDGLDGVSDETGRRYMQAWTNPRNGFRIISIEVEADPARRSAQQLAEFRASLGVSDAIWAQEFRKEFYRRGGKPVFEREFSERLMVRDVLPPIPSEPLLVGVDFGYQRPAACVAQIVDGVQLRIYRTLIGDRTTTRAFMRNLLFKLEQWFPEWRGQVEWCCDISGNRKRGEDETAEDVLRRDFKLKPKSKYSYIPPSLDLVREYMNTLHHGESGFLVAKNPDTVFFRRGLAREYRYPRATDAHPTPDEPERKNAWRDVMDAMRYIPLNFGGHRKRHDRSRLLYVARRDIPAVRKYVS